MKKFLIIAMVGFLILLSPKAMADDVDMPATGDLWDNWGTSQDFYGQDKKGVSDEEFNKTVDKLKEKQNKFGKLFKKKTVPKGEEFSQSNETEIINEHSEKDTLPVVCVPVELSAGEGFVPVGHYQVKGEKDGDNIVLKLYQSQYMMAQFPAVETNDDFGQDTISFAQLLEAEDGQIKLIYGSLDFNAYSIIKIKN